MPDLVIEVQRSDRHPDVCLVMLSGGIDARSVMTFKNRLDAERAAGIRTFVLDLEKVPYINSTGLSYLITLTDSGDPKRPGVLLVRTQSKVKVLFDMMGLGAVFRFYNSLDEALDSLGSRVPPAKPATRPQVPPPSPGPGTAAPPPRPTPGLPASAAELPPPAAPPPIPVPTPLREEIAAILSGILWVGIFTAGLGPPFSSFQWASDGDFFAAAARHKAALDRLAEEASAAGEDTLASSLAAFCRAYERGDRKAAADAAGPLKRAAETARRPGLREAALRLDREVFSLAGAFPKDLWKFSNLVPSLLQGTLFLVLAGGGVVLMKGRPVRFLGGFVTLYVLGWLAQVLGGNLGGRPWGLNPLLTALLVGLLVGNTFPLPSWIREAMRSDYYLRTGLVLLGADLAIPRPIETPVLLFTGLLILAVGWAGYGICRGIRLENEFSVVLSMSIPSGGIPAAVAALVSVRGNRQRLAYLVPLIVLALSAVVLGLPMATSAAGASGPAAEFWMGALGGGAGGESSGAGRKVQETRDLLLPMWALVLSIIGWRVRAAGAPGRPAGRSFVPGFPWSVLGLLGVYVFFKILFPHLRPVPPPSSPHALHEPWWILAFVSIGMETRWRDLVRLQGGRPVLGFLGIQILFGLAAAGLAWALLGAGLRTSEAVPFFLASPGP